MNASEVHVWRITTAPQLARELHPLLSSAERARAERFRHDEQRQEFTIARGCLRSILGTWLGASPARLHFRDGKYGKPVLAEDAGLAFNAAHSRGIVLIAVTRGRDVGVDVEFVAAEVGYHEVATVCFSASEQHALYAVPPELRRVAFFRMWSRKEALQKATGDGLGGDLNLSVPATATPTVSLTLANGERKSWTLTDLDISSSHAAAVAVSGHELRVNVQTWPSFC